MGSHGQCEVKGSGKPGGRPGLRRACGASRIMDIHRSQKGTVLASVTSRMSGPFLTLPAQESCGNDPCATEMAGKAE